MKTLILGGVRSGKSRLAEKMASSSGLTVTYVATATPGDNEMSARIASHRERRPEDWRTVEAPLELGRTLQEIDHPDSCLIVDCITLWLTNLLHQVDDTMLDEQRTDLLGVLPKLQSEVIIVSNEVNMGVVPMGELSRKFCDTAGWLHQDLAELCDRVILTVAGLPQILKGDQIGYDPRFPS